MKAPDDVSESIEVLLYRHPDEFADDVEKLFALGERDSVAFGTAW